MTEFLLVLGGVAGLSVAIQLLIAQRGRKLRSEQTKRRKQIALTALEEYKKAVAREASKYTRIGSADVLNLQDYYVNQSISIDDRSVLLSPLDLIVLGENRVIVGDAGSGKSTLASFLCIQAIETGRLPLPVHVRDLDVLPSDPDFFEEHLRSLQGPRYGTPLDALDATLWCGGGFVILDGYDEILDLERKDVLRRSVLRLTGRFPAIQILLFSRPLEEGFQSWTPSFSLARLLPFSEEKVYQFGQKWLSSESGWVLEKLAGLVRSSERIRDLLRIPLFLEISLFLVNRGGEAATSRKTLLEQAVQKIIAIEANRRHGQRSRLTEQDRRELLVRLAAHLEDKKRGLLSRDDLLEVMRKYLMEDRNHSTAKADDLAAVFLEDFLYRNSILLYSGAGYSFLHKAFQDFFVALGLRSDRLGAFRERLNDPDAAEVCLLLLHEITGPATVLREAYRNGVPAHARVAASALLDGIQFDYSTPGLRNVIVDLLGEDGVQESRFAVLQLSLSELPGHEASSLVDDVYRTYKNRPEILAVVKEVLRSRAVPAAVPPSTALQLTRREVRLIAESQAPTRALARLLNELDPGPPFDIVLELYDVVEATERVTKDLSSGSASDYDIVVQPHRRLGLLATNGLIQPINRFLAEQSALGEDDPTKTVFQDWWKEMSWYGGLCYGFPLLALTMFVWLRQDLLNDSDLRTAHERKYHRPLEFPSTLQAFRELAEFMSESEATPYGLVLQGRTRLEAPGARGPRHPGLYHEWLNFLYAHGGRVLQQEFGWEYGPIVVNSPESIASLEFYSSLFQSSFCHPGSLEFTWDDLPRVMLDGEAAMCVMWNDAVFELVQGGTKEFCFGVLPSSVASPASQSDGWSMFVPTRAREPQTSFAFMKWVLQKSVQLELQRRGGASPVRKVYDDEKVRSLPYTEASLAAMETRVPRETIPESEEMWQVLSEQLERVIRGEVSARTALDNAALQFEQELLAGKTARRYVD